MRAVTFADARLVDYLKRHFVLLWHNQAPEAPSPPPADSREETTVYPEGSGGSNLRAYVCNADGTICYVLEGYWGPERFLARMQQGHDLYRKLTSLPPAQRLRQAGHELTQHLWDLGRARRRLRDEHGVPASSQGSAAAEDARLLVLERAVLASADLFAQPVAPILRELEEKNRVRVYR